VAEYDIKELRLQQDRLHRMELATCATDFRYFSQFLVTDDEEMQKQRVFPDLEQFPHVKKIHDAYEETAGFPGFGAVSSRQENP